jgi:hypothetical protein
VSELLYGFKTLRYKDGKLYSLIPAEWFNYRYRLDPNEEYKFPGTSFYPYRNYELHAVCLGDHFKDPCPDPPSRTHNCGIHASWSIRALRMGAFWDTSYLKLGPLLLVVGWGKTVIHEDGWRSAHARVIYRVTGVNDNFGAPADLPCIHVGAAAQLAEDSKMQFTKDASGCDESIY